MTISPAMPPLASASSATSLHRQPFRHVTPTATTANRASMDTLQFGQLKRPEKAPALPNVVYMLVTAAEWEKIQENGLSSSTRLLGFDPEALRENPWQGDTSTSLGFARTILHDARKRRQEKENLVVIRVQADSSSAGSATTFLPFEAPSRTQPLPFWKLNSNIPADQISEVRRIRSAQLPAQEKVPGRGLSSSQVVTLILGEKSPSPSSQAFHRAVAKSVLEIIVDPYVPLPVKPSKVFALLSE